jgi:2-polyprenyl-6-methoxyphenol hydroxylase-like FAD-dependent oxidoreductase
MSASDNTRADVLVVGAGPTGLTMACELARHGITPRIIDKAPASSDKSKSFGIHARTLELFERWA